MKFIKALFLIAVILAVILLITAVIFLKTSDFNRFKDQIVAQASAALGRDVAIDKLSFTFSLKKGTVLDIEGLKIAEDERWGTGNFLESGRLYLDVDLLAFLLDRKFVISNVRLIDPKIVLIKNQYNRWNTYDLGPRKSGEPGAAAGQQPSGEQEPAKAKRKKLEQFLIKSVHIEGGTLTYIDTGGFYLSPLTLSQIDFDVSDFSLEEKPFDFRMKMAAWSSRQNVSVNGKMRISPENGQARLDDVNVNVALSKAYEDHTESPLLDNVKALKQWRGKLGILVSQMVVDKSGILVLSAEGKISDSEARVVDFPLTFKNILLNFEATENDVIVSGYSAEVGSGKVLGSAQLENYRKDYRMKVNTEIVRMKLPELVQFDDPDMKLQGELFGLISLTAAKSDDFIGGLKGQASFEVQGGRLMGVNIIKSVFSNMTFIPGLVDVAMETIPNKYKRIFKDVDTDFKSVNVETALNDGIIEIKRAVVAAEKYQVEIKGTCDFRLRASLTGVVYLSEEFATNLVASVPEFQALAEPDGRIKIPLKPYQGPLEKIRMFPDTKNLSKDMLIQRGQQELDKVLDKVFGRDAEETGSPSPQNGESGQPAQKAPEQILIEGVLDSIFGKPEEKQ